MQTKHFLSLNDIDGQQLRKIIARARELKALQAQNECPQSLRGKSAVLIFEKPSTRTRISFELGLQQLGANTSCLNFDATQLSRSESPEDTAQVLSYMADVIIIRANSHDTLTSMAQRSRIPVINALTDREHPCQLLADMQTYFEHRGDIRNRTVAWFGDGTSNVCRSYIDAAHCLDFRLRIACPAEAMPGQLASDPGRVKILSNPETAARDADLLVTDVWTSMGQEAEQQQREKLFRDYALTRPLLKLAKPDALYMHCLPAWRDKEISARLLDAKDTVIWEEAGNRLSSQKALLEFLLC